MNKNKWIILKFYISFVILNYSKQTSVLVPNGNPFDYWFDQQIPTETDIIIDYAKKIGETIDNINILHNKLKKYDLYNICCTIPGLSLLWT